MPLRANNSGTMGPQGFLDKDGLIVIRIRESLISQVWDISATHCPDAGRSSTGYI